MNGTAALLVAAFALAAPGNPAAHEASGATSDAGAPQVAEVAETPVGVAAAGQGAEEPAGESTLTVTTHLTPEGEKHVGDLLVLEVRAAHEKGVTVNLPMGLDFAPLELVSAEKIATEPTGEGLRTSFRLTLQTFELGEGTIPPFRLTYVDATGAVRALTVPAKSFEIAALTANEAEPERRGEDPPVSLEYPNATLEKAIYLAAIGLLLFGIVVVLIRLYLARSRPIVVPPPRPAHELALAALRELEVARDELIRTGQLQSYYLELTEIAKAYLQGRFHVDALDRTTDEIRSELLAAEREGTKLGRLEARTMIRFLQECDLVKFARFTPPAEEACHALEQVRTIVRTTMPEREEPTQGEGARA